jgi:hypothetical protein
MSGLCLHMIQIRPEYQVAPDKAWAISKEKESATAFLCDAERVEGRPGVICPLTALQGCGGSFELHEIPFGMFGHESPPWRVKLSMQPTAGRETRLPRGNRHSRARRR